MSSVANRQDIVRVHRHKFAVSVRLAVVSVSAMIYFYIGVIATGNLLAGYWFGKRVKSHEIDDEVFGESHTLPEQVDHSDDDWDDDDALEQEVLDEALSLQNLLTEAPSFRTTLASIAESMATESGAEQASEQAEAFVAAGESFLAHIEDILPELEPADDDSGEASRAKIQLRGKIERDAASVRSHAMEVRSLASLEDKEAVAATLQEALDHVQALPSLVS